MALDALLDALERLPVFNRILNTLPAPGRRLSVGGLPGSADATMVAALIRRLPTRFSFWPPTASRRRNVGSPISRRC